MSLADGDLIDTDGPRRRQPRPLDLLLHIELIQVLHRSVVQTFHLGHRLVRHIPAQLAHMRRKALGVARVVRQPVQVFYMHTTAPTTVDAPTLVFQIDPPACQRQVADPAHLLVIAPPAPMPTVRAHGCFFRLLSWMTRAYRSPNTPFNRAPATKPGSAKSERIDWGFFTRLAYPKNGSLLST